MPRIVKADPAHQRDPELTAPLHLDDVAAEAKRMIRYAQRQADRIVAMAREEAETARLADDQAGYSEGLARGRREGYAEGRQAGLQEAQQQFRTQADELLALLKQIVSQLEDARREILQSGRTELLELAVALARKIVGVVAVRDIEAARINLAKVLEARGAAGEITLKVNPGQLRSLREYCKELDEGMGRESPVQLEADERVGPGGVKLQTPGGEIDATIETQLDNVVSALLGPGRLFACGGEPPPAGECEHEPL